MALRANAIVGATVVFFFGLQYPAMTRLRDDALELVARHAGWDARVQLAGICIALASVATGRVTLGTRGWIRSLPASRAAARRAIVGALCVTQAFGIAVICFALIAAPLVYRAELDPAKVVGLPLIVVAAAMLVTPFERPVAALLAGVALAALVPGRWTSNVAGAALLLLADRTAGAVGAVRRRRADKRRVEPSRASAARHWMRLTSAALAPSAIASCLFAPSIFVLFAYLIVRHNPDLEPSTAHRAIRVCGVLALTMLAAAAGSSVVRARPVWPWARSLPWSSGDRAAGDTALQALMLVLVPVSLVPLDWAVAASIAVLVPVLSAATAAAIRVGSGRHTSAAGEIMLVGASFGTLFALWPWTGIVSLAAAPLLFALTIARDRRLAATRWHELRHDAAGDPSWTTAL